MKPILTAMLLAIGALSLPAAGVAAPKGCPPGLAKKAVPCVPPGQVQRYDVGDRIERDYRVIRNPERYGLRRNETYFRVGDYVYRVDRETRKVLDLIGAIAAFAD